MRRTALYWTVYASLCVTAMTASSLPIIVRRAAEHLLIELRLPGQQPRIMQRPATEALERTLGRLSSTFSKPKNKRDAPIPPPEIRLCDASGTAMAPSSTALDAWSTAATLSVGADTQLAVFFEPAEVCELLLPAIPLVGIPMRPLVTTVRCEPSGCSWLWERQESTEAGWEVCGTEAEYQPVAADEGALLRVRAEPPAPSTAATDEAREAALSLLGRVTEAVSAVELPPTRTQHQQRIASMASSSSSSSSSFRLLSYNLLADSYSRNWDGPHAIHSYCNPSLTKASRRMPKLLHEVLSFCPDVLCLQEVDKTWYQQLWLPMLSARGYTGRLTLKRGQGSSEGVATFVRDGAFEVVDVREIGLDASSSAAMPLLSVQEGTRDGINALPTVAQLLLLRSTSAPKEEVLLANTHLYFANPAVHVRLLQTSQIVTQACEWIEAIRSDGGAAPAMVIAGDLNSDSTDAVLRYLTNGQVKADDPDWLYGAFHWGPSLRLPEAAAAAAQESAAVLAASDNDAEEEEAWLCLQLQEAASAGDDDGLVTIESARKVATRLHLLRKAIQTVIRSHHALRGASGMPAAAADDDDGPALLNRPNQEALLKRAALEDCANGKTLFESDALASLEICRQLNLPLSRMEGGGSSTKEETVKQAAARLSELAAEVDSMSVALRERLTDGVTADVAASEYAGASLTQPTPLTSAYGLHTNPTHVVSQYANALDWILFDGARLELKGVAALPSLEELKREVALPSTEFPSDHVSLICDVEWRQGVAEVE